MTYQDLINSKATVLVEFYASWCPHCRRMMPVVEQIRELLGDRADVYQLDVDENKATVDEVGVQSMPTFIIYSHGKEVWRRSGEMDGEVLLGKVESYMN